MSEQADLGGARDLDHFLHRVVHVIEHQILDSQPRVLFTRNPEVEHVDVEARLHQVFHQAVAGRQVKHVGLEYETVSQKHRHGTTAAVAAVGTPVTVEPGIVTGPDFLPGPSPGRKSGPLTMPASTVTGVPTAA